jgi:hypothetical protein
MKSSNIGIDQPLSKLSERAFQDMVIDLAHLCKWKVTHFRPARVIVDGKETFRTALQGDKGFPDLILARSGTVIHAELKTDKGVLSQEQILWSYALGNTWRLWRPCHWPQIVKELSNDH